MKYKNLKIDDNALNKEDEKKLWLPGFQFTNSEQNSYVLDGNSYIIQIARKGNPVLKGLTSLNEERLYTGGYA